MIDYGRSWVEKSHSWDLGFVPSLFQFIKFGWITWDRVGPLGGKCRTIGWEGRGVLLASRHLQGFSPRLCRLRTDRLAPVSKHWTYQSHAGVMGPVSWCSCVTTWPKPLSPTPRLSWGRKNEVTRDDGRANLSLVVKTSSGCRGMFHPCED
jgi:hypothetical protein